MKKIIILLIFTMFLCGCEKENQEKKVISSSQNFIETNTETYADSAVRKEILEMAISDDEKSNGNESNKTVGPNQSYTKEGKRLKKRMLKTPSVWKGETPKVKVTLKIKKNKKCYVVISNKKVTKKYKITRYYEEVSVFDMGKKKDMYEYWIDLRTKKFREVFNEPIYEMTLQVYANLEKIVLKDVNIYPEREAGAVEDFGFKIDSYVTLKKVE